MSILENIDNAVNTTELWQAVVPPLREMGFAFCHTWNYDDMAKYVTDFPGEFPADKIDDVILILDHAWIKKQILEIM